MTAEDFERDMRSGVWVQVWTAFAATKGRTRRERLFWFHYAGIHVFRELLFLRIYKTPSMRSRAISHRSYSCTASTSSFRLCILQVLTKKSKAKPTITWKVKSTDGRLTAEQAAAGVFTGNWPCRHKEIARYDHDLRRT
ncbi:hypothetical protein EDD17DRAFT_1008249 [Pisolithus thermaeus]|nr:hypothetical protein EV401DRAFT_470550 [Pisolithus croceorrhizus]KAI6158438.1 hypothetical protein EDD17DRAFT_1008249 [Pisolithus thermaeus]